MSPPTLVLYTRALCHLCDEAKLALERLSAEVDFGLEVRDVDTREEWERAYGEEVPVGFVDGRKVFKYRVDPTSLRRSLRRRRP